MQEEGSGTMEKTPVPVTPFTAVTDIVPRLVDAVAVIGPTDEYPPFQTPEAARLL